MYEPMSCLEFAYPELNSRSAHTDLRSRRIVVRETRDTIQKPIAKLTIWNNPDLCRSRFLILGYDLDKKTYRSFYTDSMREIEVTERRWMQIAIYSPCENIAPEFLPTLYSDSRIDQHRLKNDLRAVNRMLLARPGEYVAGAFPFLFGRKAVAA